MFSFVLQMCKNVQETKQKTKAKTKTEEKNQKKKKTRKKFRHIVIQSRSLRVKAQLKLRKHHIQLYMCTPVE